MRARLTRIKSLATAAQRWQPSARTLMLAAIAVFGIGTACSEGRLPTDPNRLSPSVRLSLNATVSSAGRAMKLTASYAQAVTPTVLIPFFTTTVTLTGDETELPIRIDIAGCVADPARELPDPPTGDLSQTCILHIALSLLDADGKQIDAVMLPPISAKPGAAVTSPPVVLGSVVTSVAILPRAATINAISFTSKLNATVIDNFGAVVPSAAVTWTSLSPTIATVDTVGVVTARGVGTTRIVATSREKTDTATITVRQLLKSVTITGAPASIQMLDSVTVAAVVRDSADVVIPPAAAPVTFSSSDPAVLNVDPATGKVRAIAVGTASVRATSGSVIGSASIVVRPIPIAKVVVSPASGTAVVGETFTYLAQPQDAGGAPLAGRVVTWTSSDTAIATISSAGVATAKRVGVATITATSEGVNGVASLTVSPRPATKLVIATQPGGAITGAALAPQPVVQVKDASDGVVVGSSAPVTAILVGSGGTLSGTTTVNAVGGIATFTNLVVKGVGSYTLTFTSGSLSAATSGAIAIAPLPATQIGVATQPGGAQTGSALSPQPVVQVRNAEGGTVAGATTAITVTLTGDGTLAGTTTVNAVDGVAKFADLVVNGVGSYTLTFTGGGLASATSASFTTTPRPATQLAMATQPGGALTGSALAPQPVVQVKDAIGGVVVGSSVPVTVALVGSGGTLSGTTTVNAVAGVATFTNLVVTGAGSYTLTFSSGSLAAATSTSFAIAPLPATQLGIGTQPGGAQTGSSLAPQPVVQVRNSAGGTVAGATTAITATLVGSGGTLAGTTTVNAVDGVATFTDLVVNGVGSFTLTFSGGGLTSVTSASFTTTARPATQLAITTQPGGAVTLSALSPQPVIQVRDAVGGTVAGATNAVTATLVGAGGTLSGTTTVNAIDGVATFSDLVVTGPGDYTLTFSSGALAATTSSSITIAPLPPKQLGIGTQPGTAQAGSALAPQPVVLIRNVSGGTVAGATNAVTATLVGSGGTLSGTTTVNAVNGVATFTDLVVSTEGSYTITFTSGTLTSATSSTFPITPRPATRLGIVTQPGGVKTGAALAPQPVVQVQNAIAGKVTAATNPVTATLNGSGGTLSGTTAVNAVDGVATFTNLVVTGVASYSLTFSSGTLTPATSTTFGITALAATQLVIATQPAGSTTGSLLSTQPVVHVRDSTNANVAGATNLVTASLAAGSAGTLSGTTAVSAVNGIASFTDLRISGAGSSSIVFTAVGLASAISSTVVTAPLPATRLVVGTQPGGAITGDPLAPQPVVQVQDAGGGVVTGSSAPVTATLSAGGTLLGTATVNAISGIASFSNLAVSGPGTYTLAFASGTLTGATSATFTIAPLPPTQLGITTQPGGAQTGSALAPQPVVEVRNAGGSVVAGATNAVTATLIGSGGTLSGATTVNAINGVATFSDLVVNGAGSYTITFASSGLTSATSGSVVITPRPATRLAISTQPGGAITGDPLAPQPVVQVQDAVGGVVNESSAAITATLSAGGTLVGTTTVNAINGIASFSNLAVSGPGTYTLAFASGTLTGATSATFTIAPLPPTQLGITTQPGGAQTGSALAPQPVVEVRNAGGSVVAGATNAVTATLIGSGGTLSGATTVNAINGVATFSNLVITGAGSYTLTFSASGLTPATSTSIVITPLPASRLSIATQPGGATTRSPLSPQPVVQVQDASGAVVISSATVTATLTGSGGTLLGTTTVNAVNGIATFSDLRIAGPGAYTITFSASTLSSATSGSISINPLPPALLSVRTSPSGAVSGSPLAPQPVVEVWNDDDAVVSGATNAVTVELLGTGVLSGTTTVNAVNGVASFTDLVVEGAGAYRLQFSSGALVPAGSSAFTITARPPTHLAVATAPVGARTGQALSTQPVIHVKDAAEGVVAGATSVVTATLDGGGTLSGTTSVAAVNGVATFTNLVVTGPGTYTITFSSEGLSPVTSGAIIITPPPAASIGINMGASEAVAGTVGTALDVPIVAEMSNAQGKVLASLSLTITWDPTKFDYVSFTNGTFGRSPSYITNTSNAIYGSLAVSVYDADTGFSTGAPRIYTVTLRPKVSSTGTAVTSTVTAAGDEIGRPIPLSTFIVRPVTVTTPPPAGG